MLRRPSYFSGKVLGALRWSAIAAATALVAVSQVDAKGPQTPAPAGCRVTGTVKSGTTGLPGVAMIIKIGDALHGTSTDDQGKFSFTLAQNVTAHIEASLMAFTTATKDLTVGAVPCDTTLDLTLSLLPRNTPIAAPEAAAPAAPPASSAAAAQAGQPPVQGAQTAGAAATTTAAGRPGAPAQAAAATGRGAGARGAGQGFQQLNVQTDANGTAAADAAARPTQAAADAASILPPGFSLDSEGANAVTINGSANATNVDRNAMNDRFGAFAAGAIDPTTGQAIGGAPGGLGGDQGFGGGGGRGGGQGGRGGGLGGFTLGGRGGRGQNLYQGSVTYSFAGSALNATPFALPSAQAQAQEKATHYDHNNFGGTFGGPIKIPGLYDDTNRRTNFQLNYTGQKSNNLFDQYATVPTLAMRSGDFSSVPYPIINPKTGLPFPGNQIPASAIDPGALLLMQYIPAPNLGGTTQNYHISSNYPSTSNSLSLRVTQNLSPTVFAGGGRGGRGGGGGGGRGGGGPGGRGSRPMTIMLTANVQYRGSNSTSLNDSPLLGGTSTSTNLAVPISVNISKGRTNQTISYQFTSSRSQTLNHFANTNNVAAAVGLTGPNGTMLNSDPSLWGVPSISFTSFSGIRDVTPSLRTDHRTHLTYTFSRPWGSKQTLRFGTDYQVDTSTNHSGGSANGSLTFNGFYASGGLNNTGTTGVDFADFMLGDAVTATLNQGGTTSLRGRSFDAYMEDDLRATGTLTFQIGVRYELVFPYYELAYRMANLDVAPDFSNVSTVLSGGTGAFTGTFPKALLNADDNNVAPRVGFAWRPARGTILRGGYGISFNGGSYANIARLLTQQPPFYTNYTNNGALNNVLTFENALSSVQQTLNNTYGVDKNYQLGMTQTSTLDVTRQLTRNWSAEAGYTYIHGSDVDQLLSPNSTAAGLVNAAITPYRFETSGGYSNGNIIALRLSRLLASGFSGSVNYTYEKLKDDASFGGGVVENAANPTADYGISALDRPHQLTSQVLWELPWGANRRWLDNEGFLAQIVGGWSFTMTYTFQSGQPLNPYIPTSNGIQSGLNGVLRLNVVPGVSPVLSSPVVTGNSITFLNAAAFTAPANGAYGNAPRYVVFGPSSHTVNMQLNRDIRMGGNRAMTLSITASNLFNTQEYAGVSTNYLQNFGQVTSFRAPRSMTVNLRFRF